MASWSPVSWFRISANLGGRAFAHGKLWSPRAAWHTHVLWEMGLDLALSHPPVLFHFSAVFPCTYAALARSLHILPLCKRDILTHPESLKLSVTSKVKGDSHFPPHTPLSPSWRGQACYSHSSHSPLFLWQPVFQGWVKNRCYWLHVAGYVSIKCSSFYS